MAEIIMKAEEPDKAVQFLKEALETEASRLKYSLNLAKKRLKKFEKKYNAKYVSFKKLLTTSDFITMHVLLLPTTKHLISTKELKMMKNTAYLINTSRGPVVDENALIKALEKREIAGAGLDVYETEPNVNPRLTALQNCILTPHTASATVEVRMQMGKDATDNIIAILSGKKAKKTVNPEVYAKKKK